VLSYLSVGRPIIALVPDGNPCAADVLASGGFVSAPTRTGALAAANWLVEITIDPVGLASIGTRARNLAAKRFNIDRIGSEFEKILADATRRDPLRGRAPLIVVGPDGGGGMG
jgi:hypothetical protein